MSSYILPSGFTQLRSTNRAVCSDPDSDDGDVTRNSCRADLVQIEAVMALYGIPLGRPWSDPGSDRGDDDVSLPDDVISTAVLSFSHLQLCSSPSRAVVRAADFTRDFRCVPSHCIP